MTVSAVGDPSRGTRMRESMTAPPVPGLGHLDLHGGMLDGQDRHGALRTTSPPRCDEGVRQAVRPWVPMTIRSIWCVRA